MLVTTAATPGTPREAGVSIDRSELARFVAGDQRAFARVFAALRGEIVAVVRRYFRAPSDQEEAFQEAWLQIYRNRGRIDVNRHSEFPAWAGRVARNRCLDLLKARGRRPEVPVEEIYAATPATQQQSAQRTDMRQALEAFVAGLKPELAELFRLCLVEERPHEEVARKLGITVRRSKYLKKKLVLQMLQSRSLQRAAGE